LFQLFVNPENYYLKKVKIQTSLIYAKN
jgi:hypothetical protein